MKKYNPSFIRDYIEKNKENIESVDCGIKEDWSWTAETVFEDNEYCYDLINDDIRLVGISGSIWATPVMEVNFKDGRTEIVNCFKDDNIKADDKRMAEAKYFASLTGGMDYLD